MPQDHQTKKRPGGKLSRSETVTVRLDPKLRYLADLAARKQRRTLSSFVEWAIEEALAHVEVTNANDEKNTLGAPEMARWLWDIDEADRLVKLAVSYPDLLTYDEQRQWKVISESALCKDGIENRDVHKMDLARLRRNWPLAVRLAKEGKAAIDFDSSAV